MHLVKVGGKSIRDHQVEEIGQYEDEESDLQVNFNSQLFFYEAKSPERGKIHQNVNDSGMGETCGESSPQLELLHCLLVTCPYFLPPFSSS